MLHVYIINERIWDTKAYSLHVLPRSEIYVVRAARTGPEIASESATANKLVTAHNY